MESSSADPGFSRRAANQKFLIHLSFLRSILIVYASQVTKLFRVLLLFHLQILDNYSNPKLFRLSQGLTVTVWMKATEIAKLYYQYPPYQEKVCVVLLPLGTRGVGVNCICVELNSPWCPASKQPEC